MHFCQTNFPKTNLSKVHFSRNFAQALKDLDSPQQKKCLSSLILFPGNTVVKKSLLAYLWKKEGFLEPRGEALEEILVHFTKKEFILPVNQKFHKVANSFKIEEIVHFAMILLGDDSRSDGDIFSWFDNWECCLKKSKQLELKSAQEVKTLFNVNKGSLDFKLESFLKMKSVEVLYIGRWQRWDEYSHIDVKNSEFLGGLKNMEKLKFLSLQGISGIQELPSSISNLTSLEILDLRACYNLEKLPKEIGSLKKLTHLDISECYFLDFMPKELLSLSELQVLKGFVIMDTENRSFCTLAELIGLEKLTKLSINLHSVTFSVDQLSVVFKFKQLLKLKITWGGKISTVKQSKNSKQEYNEAKSKDPNSAKKGVLRMESALGEGRSSEETKIIKLELQSLPLKALPNWVIPENLRSLKKLYIRGGGLQSLGRIDHQKWKVDVLCLKYLTELEINWIELMTMFPELQYVEKFKCPKATLFPCDCYGVWFNSPEKKQSTS